MFIPLAFGPGVLGRNQTGSEVSSSAEVQFSIAHISNSPESRVMYCRNFGCDRIEQHPANVGELEKFVKANHVRIARGPHELFERRVTGDLLFEGLDGTRHCLATGQIGLPDLG